MDNIDVKTLSREKESLVLCQTSEGLDLQATLLRLTRHHVVFEVYSPQALLRMSEVLSDFKIVINDRPAYSGRAVVTSLVSTGSVVICEASLEDSWLDVDMFAVINERSKLRAGFDEFVRQWQRFYQVRPEFKLLVADMQTFLTDLRLWMEQVELGIRSTPSGDRSQLEQQVISELVQPVIPTLNSLFEKFETVAQGIDGDQQPAHHTYLKRQIHPLVLCSPFAYRTFKKPLGYAGDYEMVNMLMRNPQEGGSVFAKVLNVWFVSQPPAEAHRNRITYLTRKLIEEGARVSSQNRLARVFNLGCGPAWEVQHFLAQNDLCDRTDCTLVDFNDETLAYAGQVLNDIKTRQSRRTPIKLVKKSVAQILKGGSKVIDGAPDRQFDFLYCAGLFDYLPDRVCKQLMNIFYSMLAPGGLLVATNVDTSNPIRHMLDYVLEWHLIYRNGKQMHSFCPDQAHPDQATVRADDTGVNLYLEVRKPSS
jgi:extracellular factor (EF) 3-hydroxypalmitic acid methyl ester biosynthesis protein